jgi:hypothetical protein
MSPVTSVGFAALESRLPKLLLDLPGNFDASDFAVGSNDLLNEGKQWIVTFKLVLSEELSLSAIESCVTERSIRPPRPDLWRQRLLRLCRKHRPR